MFAGLPPEALDDLLKPNNKANLHSIPTHPVLPDKVTAKDVMKLSTAEAVNGKRLSINAPGGGEKVDNAKVIKSAFMCSNSVIHVIDTVASPIDSGRFSL
jgi:uncharacterized surface protein with fasciclin (FAS1) repeats